MLTGGDEEVEEAPKEVVVVETTEIEKEEDNQLKIVN